jgi:endonuclease YncB( thermonuclease family)
LGGLAWQRWNVDPGAGKPDAPIEWNSVQAVPTRTPDADDVAWEKRSQEPTAEPVIASPEGARQSSLDRVAKARDDGIYVIDGDTFLMGGQRIRVAGIDAPETHPPRCMEEARLGLAATQKLRDLLGSGTVTISGAGHDQFGRDLRSVQVGGQDVGAAMISAGMARSYDGKKRQGWCG